MSDATGTAPRSHDEVVADPVTPVTRAYLPVGVAVALLALVPALVGDSRTYMGVAIGVVVTAMYATGFNLVLGSTGQLFLCVGALGGVGGYGTAILADRAGLPVLVALLVATGLAGGLGALFSWVSVRRSLGTIFTGVVTLTFGLGFESLLLGQRGLTGGEDGIRVEAGRGTFLADDVAGYLTLLAVLALFLTTFRALERSHHGWAFRALRGDETTARLAGVDVAAYRVRAGAIGAAMVGLTGALFALHEGRITPTTYGFVEVDVASLLVVALGGLGTLLAPVTGAVSLGLLDELVLRDLNELRTLVRGAILLVLFMALRDGLAGVITAVRGRGSRPATRRPAAGSRGRPAR